MRSANKVRAALDIGVRIVADILMVNIALGVAVLTRYILAIEAAGSGDPQEMLQRHLETYLDSFWILTVIATLIFYACGFYTRGRFYQGRYKALVVLQAVTLSYLIFGFVAFLSQGSVSLPRSVLFGGWFLTATILIAARLWSLLWRMLHTGEVTRASERAMKPRAKGILVIGGAGYIGSALLPKLLERGYEVRLLDLFLFGKEPIANVLGHPKLQIVQADFRHVDKVVQALKGMDEVIHLGAIVGDPACSIDQELTVEVNLMATRMIAEVAKGSGIKRFSFASTCSVYGASDQILDERSKLNPLSLYAKSKLASEKVLMQLADQSFSPVIVRFGTIYGLSGRTRFDLVINLLTAKAVIDGKITLFGGGQWRPFLHVDDAALALVKIVAAADDLVHAQVFNVGSNEQNYQLGQAANLIHSLVPHSEVIDMGADTDFRNYQVDFTKLKKMIGFVPQWSMEDGVKQVIAALKSGEVRDYRHPTYSNVKFLSEEGSSALIRREKSWADQLINQEVAASGSAALATPTR